MIKHLAQHEIRNLGTTPEKQHNNFLNNMMIWSGYIYHYHFKRKNNYFNVHLSLRKNQNEFLYNLIII